MMKRFLILLLLFCVVFNTDCLYGQTYHVKKTKPGVITIDGRANDRVWKKANILDDFTYPWENVTAPATSFAALWDGGWLYCLYRVQDDSINVYVKTNDKQEIGASDRVEIFMKADDRMSPYYCLELDAAGRIFDYNATFHRKMNYPWQWPKEQLVVKASRTKDGYIVEFAISIQSLKEFGLLKDNRLQAGLFRAECKSITDGNADLHWISWIKPQSGQPDFHIPSAFGILILE